MDKSSGRNELNAGSDSAKHYGRTSSQEYDSAPKASPSTRTTAPNGNAVRDERPSTVTGSAVK